MMRPAVVLLLTVASVVCSPAGVCAMAAVMLEDAEPPHACCQRRAQRPVLTEASPECCAAVRDAAWPQLSRIEVAPPATAPRARSAVFVEPRPRDVSPLLVRTAPLVLRI